MLRGGAIQSLVMVNYTDLSLVALWLRLAQWHS
jgi:hypothetical protein